MRHHILPLEQGWSLPVSLRLSGRDSSFKEHPRMLLEALWSPPRLFVCFLVALPLQHEQSDFCMSCMRSWISYAVPYNHYGFGSGSFLGSMINTKQSESLSKVWDDKNKPGRQPDQCFHQSDITAHNKLFDTGARGSSGLLVPLPLPTLQSFGPTDLILEHQRPSKKP